MDKKSEEIFNKLYDLHDRYDEDPKHMICAEAADHIKKLSEELEKLKATSENKALTLEELLNAIRNISYGSPEFRNSNGCTDSFVVNLYKAILEEAVKEAFAYARKSEGSKSNA